MLVLCLSRTPWISTILNSPILIRWRIKLYNILTTYWSSISIYISFGGGYSVYHSMYDAFVWMSEFGNPMFSKTCCMDSWVQVEGAIKRLKVLVYKVPTLTIDVIPWIVQHEILNNRRHVLTKDNGGSVKLWGITKGVVIEDYGQIAYTLPWIAEIHIIHFLLKVTHYTSPLMISLCSHFNFYILFSRLKFLHGLTAYTRLGSIARSFIKDPKVLTFVDPERT
ncbi:uncharacterized protein LOC111908032 isoform X2 [Lactuca sativa]|uniref:uncharacterized protein LOC111908032 isoform X2 n=1 Tax=Lactuca sativa TaxID=4236 RepID=UPI001C68BD51|nr:uncharacterized protein LOC111908032 isoform X2 [Lactuca sativa]